MKTFFKDKSLYDYPHLIAILIVLLFGRTLGIGTGVVVAGWYCKCMSKQYAWYSHETGVLQMSKEVLSKVGVPRDQGPASTKPD